MKSPEVDKTQKSVSITREAVSEKGLDIFRGEANIRIIKLRFLIL